MALPYNIFKELGLTPDISDRDNAVLAEAEKQYRTWMKRVNMGPRAKEKMNLFKEMISAIKANPTLIAEHAALYNEVIKQERIAQEKAIRDDASIFVVHGEIEEKNLRELVSRNKALSEAEILRILGAKVRKKKVFSYTDDSSIPEVVPTLYNQISGELDKLGKRSLYDFLNLKSNASVAEIQRTAQTMYDANQRRPNNDQKILVNNLIAHCKSMLCDESKRKSYDKSLSNAGFISIREKLFRLSVVTPEQYKSLLEECTRNGIPRDKAEYLIYQAAESKNITIVESTENDNLRTCRFCGSLNAEAANSCKTCGMPLEIVCPKCGKKSTDPDELKCTKCGFSIGDMPTADLNVKSASTAIGLGNIEDARNYIEAAKRLWPAHPRLKQLESDLVKVSENISTALSDARKLASEHRYYAASSLLPKIGFSAEAINLRRDVESSIEAAEKVVAQASATTDANKRIDLYMQALSLCADCKIAVDKLRLTPPSPPANISSRADNSSIHLEWPKSGSQFLRYKIVKKPDSRPNSLTDGEVVGITSDSMFDDTKIKPGVSYFYAVYALCGDIVSRTGAVTSHPAMITPDLDARKVTYNIQASSIGLNWQLPAAAKGVDVYRDGKLLRSVNGETYTDSGLQSGTEYSYLLRCVYTDAAGKRIVTPGIAFRLRPIAPPTPVKLSVENRDNNFRFTWTSPSRGSVVLFRSSEQPKFNEGDVVNLDTIKATRVNVTGNSCIINKDFNGVQFFTPVTIEGTIGVSGNTISIESVRPPQDVNVMVVDSHADITWKWGESESVKISWQIDSNSSNSRIIAKPAAESLRINLPSGVNSLKVTVAGYITIGNREMLSDPIFKNIALGCVKVDYTAMKSESVLGFFGRDRYSVTLRSYDTIPCGLRVLVGEGLPPIDLSTANCCHTINPNDLTTGNEIKIQFSYSRRDKSKKLFFRIVPQDPAMMKRIAIIPDTRNI